MFYDDYEDFELEDDQQYERFFPGGPPQGGPGRPPQGGPGRPPQGGPGRPPQGGPGGPTQAPPAFTPQRPPQQSVQMQAIDPGAVRPCRHRFVYLWLRNGSSFWAWLTFVGRDSIAGWRWNGRRWVYFGMDVRRIDYFICY